MIFKSLLRVIICIYLIQERGTFQIQELLNDGGRELFILWLRDELESVTHAANHSIELIFELVQLLEYVS